MVINLETEKRNGLDESQLARGIMKLMGLSAECDGEPFDVPATEFWECSQCGRRFADWNPMLQAPTHPRIPTPLREVRDELLRWLMKQDCKFTLGYFSDGNAVLLNAITENAKTNEAVYVQFAEVEDEAVALALAATRLLGEK